MGIEAFWPWATQTVEWRNGKVLFDSCSFTEIGGGRAKAHDFAERSVRFGSNADCG